MPQISLDPEKWSASTCLLMADAMEAAQKGSPLPIFAPYARRRTGRSKRKVIYFITGPAVTIGATAALSTVTLGGAAVVLGAAVLGYAAIKGWRNSRQAYSKRKGMKKFRQRLDAQRGLNTGVKDRISPNVINRVRFFLQKGSLGRLTDDFKFAASKQIEFENALHNKPVRNCGDALKLAHLLYMTDRRIAKMEDDAADFLEFYQWVIGELDRASAILAPESVYSLLGKIGTQVSKPTDAEHTGGCSDVCYQKRNGKVRRPAISTMQYRKQAWKHSSFPRIMNDAMNRVYTGSKTSRVSYKDYQSEIREMLRGIMELNDFVDVDSRPASDNETESMVLGGWAFASGMGVTTLSSGGGAGTKVFAVDVLGLNIGQNMSQIGTTAATGGIGGLASSMVYGFGEYLNTSNEYWSVREPLTLESSFGMLKEKSARMDSLRAILKSGAFEYAIDQFIKVRQRIEIIEGIVGDDGQRPITDCREAFVVAVNLLGAIKHFGQMMTKFRYVKEYAEILNLQLSLHSRIAEIERMVAGRIEYMVKAHDTTSPCINKYCKVVADDE